MSLLSSPVIPMLTMEDPVREEGYMVAEGEDSLSVNEMDIIRSLDSRSFGFLDLNETSSDSFPSTSVQQATGVGIVSKEFLRKGINILRADLISTNCSEAMKPILLCQIGHLHLLLEQYSEALSAYQNYSLLSGDSNINTAFLYGVGLVYFTYGKYDWSLSAFQKVLYLAPDFARLSEVHIRMGLMYKNKGDFKKSMEHYNQACASAGPCTMSRLEIQFHIGHIYYMKGDYANAKQCFEVILASKNVPNNIKALTLRQLGWIYHTVPQVSSVNENPHSKAIDLLKLAVGANPTCGQAWYFLGRCHADQGQYKEAFMAYRQSVNRVEKQPDTWCAIGILYQQMGQGRDSLQAYITAIYFDVTHIATWTDLGLLYESCGQLIDSLLCYKNGLASLEKRTKRRPRKGSRDNIGDMLLNRLNFVEYNIQQRGGPIAYAKITRSSLPGLQEAWSQLVPQHLRLKYPTSESPIFHVPLSPHTAIPQSPALSPGLGRFGAPLNKKYKPSKSKDPIILRNISEGWAGNTHNTLPSQPKPYSNPSYPPNLTATPDIGLPFPNPHTPYFDPSSLLPPNLMPGYQYPSNVANSHYPHDNDHSLNPIMYYPTSTDTNSANMFSPESVFYSPQSTTTPSNLLEQVDNSPTSVNAHQLPLTPLDTGNSLHNSSLTHNSLQPIIYQQNPLIPTTMDYSDSHTMSLCSPTPVSLNGTNPLILPQDLYSVLPSSFDPTNMSLNVDEFFGDFSTISSRHDQQSGVVSENGHAHFVNLWEEPSASIEDLKRKGDSEMLGKRVRSIEESLHSPKLVASPPTQLLTFEKQKFDINHASLVDPNDPMVRPTSLPLSIPTDAVLIRKSSAQPEFDTNNSHTHAGLGSGHLSDTSSGVSSASTKFSTSPNLSSPSSSPHLVSSPFFYPSPDRNNLQPHSNNHKYDEEKLIVPIFEPHNRLGNEGEYMKEDPLRPPSPPPFHEHVELHPKLPIYTINIYDEVDLQRFCTTPDIPICIIRGLTEATEFDMSLFSTETLMKQNGDHEIEVREQILQPADKNYDVTGKKQAWRCESSRSSTTVQEYGEYQQEMLREEQRFIRSRTDVPPRKMLKFGTNCDLSDQEKWKRQLSEIKKLPKFLQVNCPEANLLNHVGHTVLGMNTVQLYLKVPGCRTPGHQENNNFCSINVNIGPGDCEWFAVSNKYWGVVHDLCEKHKISFLVGSWWPILEELEQNNVPVYQFTQYKGEVVWINPGTVHWVQANSGCNNIAWNVGPITAHQLRMSWERYQWNRMLKVRSIVPMTTLTWNLARKVKVTDPNMIQQISSYKQCEKLLNAVQTAGMKVIWHGHLEGETAPTCTQCLEEVFNILFVSTNKKGDHLVYCHKCAQQLQSKNKKQTFTVLQQYALSELKKILDKYLKQKTFSS